MVFGFLCLISLSMRICSSIHVATNGTSFLFWLSSIPLCVYVCVYMYTYTTSSLSIHLLMDIWVGCMS